MKSFEEKKKDLHVTPSGLRGTALVLICVWTEWGSYFFSWKKSLHVFILGLTFVFSFVGAGVYFDCDETLPDKVWWSLLATQHWSSKSHLQFSRLKRNLELSCWETSFKKCVQTKEEKLLFQRWMKYFHSLLNQKFHSLSSLSYGLLFFLIWKKNVSSYID